MTAHSNDTCYCDFCAKTQREVAKLIAGPLVHICNECIVAALPILGLKLAAPDTNPASA